ncbi:hypothetical protein [Methylobacterium brachiatum]|jgi:hypothetical protein|uniref:hypothetical protein n=1 Tax=Methylobacterium brachiatum TaxID=269660 RepID=UPI000EFD98E7|nr:hypothetical protein [Methylobacterium brachiatum]AYO82818.1 hypothetical protein EBB05_11470 [Methylobacterium brachiatum]
MRVTPSLIALIAMTVAAFGAEKQIRDIIPIPLQDGINHVPNATADGRAATIVRAWRENGNAHSYHVYLVLLPQPGRTEAGLVAIEDGAGGLTDSLADTPFDGERVQRSIRLARARIDGVPAVILIQAVLQARSAQSVSEPKPAEIRIYRLESPGIDAGTTPDVFRIVRRDSPPGRFCNADKALATALGLSLPPDYQGGEGPNGC